MLSRRRSASSLLMGSLMAVALVPGRGRAYGSRHGRCRRRRSQLGLQSCCVVGCYAGLVLGVLGVAGYACWMRAVPGSVRDPDELASIIRVDRRIGYRLGGWFQAASL